jgi:hypothetical protein
LDQQTLLNRDHEGGERGHVGARRKFAFVDALLQPASQGLRGLPPPRADAQRPPVGRALAALALTVDAVRA